MKAYSLSKRYRSVDDPVCGRPENHSGQCLTTEAYGTYLKANKLRQAERRQVTRELAG